MANTVLKAYEEKWKVALELDKGGVELKKQQLLKTQKSLAAEKERLERQVTQLRATVKPSVEIKVGAGNTIDMSPPLRSKSGTFYFLSCLRRSFLFRI